MEAPLDTTKVRVKLSAMSFRIPPRQTYTVFYEATADSVPAWFNIVSAMTGAKTENGLNVRILLPHVVYLNQKAPLRKEQVVVRAVEVDTAAGKLRLQLQNLGPNLGPGAAGDGLGWKDDQPSRRRVPAVPVHAAVDRGRLGGPDPARAAVGALHALHHRHGPGRARDGAARAGVALAHGPPDALHPRLRRRDPRGGARRVRDRQRADRGRGAGRRLVARGRLRRHGQFLAQRHGRLGRTRLPRRAQGRSVPADGGRQGHAFGSGTTRWCSASRPTSSAPGYNLLVQGAAGRRNGGPVLPGVRRRQLERPVRPVVPGHAHRQAAWARSSCSAGSRRRSGSPETSSSPGGRPSMPGVQWQPTPDLTTRSWPARARAPLCRLAPRRSAEAPCRAGAYAWNPDRFRRADVPGPTQTEARSGEPLAHLRRGLRVPGRRWPGSTSSRIHRRRDSRRYGPPATRVFASGRWRRFRLTGGAVRLALGGHPQPELVPGRRTRADGLAGRGGVPAAEPARRAARRARRRSLNLRWRVSPRVRADAAAHRCTTGTADGASCSARTCSPRSASSAPTIRSCTSRSSRSSRSAAPSTSLRACSSAATPPASARTSSPTARWTMPPRAARSSTCRRLRRGPARAGGQSLDRPLRGARFGAGRDRRAGRGCGARHWRRDRFHQLAGRVLPPRRGGRSATPLAVKLDEFLLPGRWEVATAPSHGRPGRRGGAGAHGGDHAPSRGPPRRPPLRRPVPARVAPPADTLHRPRRRRSPAIRWSCPELPPIAASPTAFQRHRDGDHTAGRPAPRPSSPSCGGSRCPFSTSSPTIWSPSPTCGEVTSDSSVGSPGSRCRPGGVFRIPQPPGGCARRLVARGFGPDIPTATNRTEAGNDRNRRVELRAPRPLRGCSGADEAALARGPPAPPIRPTSRITRWPRPGPSRSPHGRSPVRPAGSRHRPRPGPWLPEPPAGSATSP